VTLNNMKTTAKKSNKEIASPKGMRDIMNEEYYNFQGFFEKAQEVAVYYGFKPIETPMMESEEIFKTGVGGGTDIVDKEMYSLKTKGGDNLALRPEHTASLMRAYIEHGMQTFPQHSCQAGSRWQRLQRLRTQHARAVADAEHAERRDAAAAQTGLAAEAAHQPERSPRLRLRTHTAPARPINKENSITPGTPMSASNITSRL
jgi:hypothetical protein